MKDAINRFLARTHIAYFSMEIALRNEMHTYSGGLGVLAGDTARSCADLEIPVVFVTLISHQGYLRQEIGPDGRQIDHQDEWRPADWATPLEAKIAVRLEGRSVWVRPWLFALTCPLGHAIPVILLDTDLAENDPADRQITHYLYGGDERYRLRQEAVLGIGGTRILQALGFNIHTYHMNEGHAALLVLELLRRHPWLRSQPDAVDPAYDSEPVLESCIFTTHTPVMAGHDQFPYDLVEEVLGDFMDVDQIKRYAGSDACNMTSLALNLSGYVNGVARRHAETTRHMHPGYQIQAITNGVHTATWAHAAFARLYNSRFPQWSHEPEVLVHADELSDDEIWRAHSEAKSELIEMIRQISSIEMRPDIPLMGFARRMTEYKRPELLFFDIERLKTIHARRPFQIVLAGKAHPKDIPGKRLIEELNQHTRELTGQIQIAFVPNYDLNVAAHLVSGCDVWLNTPLPPMEASGTSGMKAAINGVLNLSVLDGWWLEAWIEGVTGWAVGTKESRDGDDAADLYEKLERTVLPLYFDDRARWIWMMKQGIAKIASYFNSQRMMRRYATEAYLR